MFWSWVVIDGGGGFDECECGWVFSGVANWLWFLIVVGEERERERERVKTNKKEYLNKMEKKFEMLDVL